MSDLLRLQTIQKVRRALAAVEDQLGACPPGSRGDLERIRDHLQDVIDTLIADEVADGVEQVKSAADDLRTVATKVRAQTQSLAQVADLVEDAAAGVAALAAAAEAAKNLPKV